MSDSINQDIVYALAASPDFGRDGLCFAARHSGLWRSESQGKQWRHMGDIPGVPAGSPVTALAVSPNFRSDGTIFAGAPGGILRSTDGGSHWTIAALSSPPPFVSALAVSPNYESDGIVWCATLEDGVFRSQDRGETWQVWNFGLFDLNTLSLAISPGFACDRRVYVGAETGIFYSNNGGRAWQETGFPTDLAPVLSLVVSPQFPQDGILFAGAEAAGLFRSVDQGQNWERVLDSATINAVLLSPDFPATAEILAVSDHTLWLSRDAGQSWSNRTPDGNFSAGFTSAVAPARFAPESKLLLGLSDGRVVWV